jgi:hypothetical protein
MSWTNSDGLVVRFGTDKGTEKESGSTEANVHRTLVHKFAFGDIANTDVTAADPESPFIPADSVITRATLYVTTAFASGGAGVLDIGLKVAAGTNTDDDGIDSVAVTVLDAIGDTINCNGPYVSSAGNLTGIRITADQYIMTTWDTAAFTAGAATLVVEYLLLA